MNKKKNIKQADNKISMEILINGKEDNSFSLVLDAESLEELENISGAESAYSGHARTKIYSLLKESPILPTETNLINRGISDYENGLTINGKESLKKMRERHGLL